jgi:2OG-Fe(II) oxygenase superfamily
MGRTARERLAKLLDDAEAPGAFSAQILAPADALQVEVDGVGTMLTPVRAPLAKKLIAVAQPAKFGRGEQTLTDTSVRDTWEITPDHVTLGGHAWEATLAAVLDGVRDELGLPPTTKLRAELHAMLVYGKGQFFLPHQDSEKDDAMVGTLVVSLPSAHTGGELAVEHCGESVTYRASKEHLSFVAFYADCRHEVKPVKSGHRVTLTLNLLADGGTDTREAGPTVDLARCLTEHFTTRAVRHYGRNIAPDVWTGCCPDLPCEFGGRLQAGEVGTLEDLAGSRLLLSEVVAVPGCDLGPVGEQVEERADPVSFLGGVPE